MSNESLDYGGQEEDLSKYKTDKGLVLRWLKELSIVKESKLQRDFEKNGERIVKKYRNAEVETRSVSTRTMFNVLWSNIQVLKPSLYSRMPKVVVERRFKDSDPVGRLAAQVCERATSFQLSSQQDRFNFAIKSAVEDRLLCGRGVVWVRYDAEFEEVSGEENDTDEVSGTPQQSMPIPGTEKVVVDYTHWMDYYESPARNPFEVRWKAKRAYMTRAKLIKRFGEELGRKIELNGPENKRKQLSGEEAEFLRQAEVFEIWDEETKRVCYLSEGYRDSLLDCISDPLKLSGFFPTPIPLTATTTTDSQYPTPDYLIYEKLADELDYVTKRISSLVECIRFVGGTAAQFNKEVKNMLNLADGQLWPIENWANWSERGGLKGAIDWLPFEQCVSALGPLIDYQQRLLAQIFEITGIPDIVRGSSDPTETLGAQQQKAHWTVVKISEKQAEVQRFCRETIAKVAEVIFEPGLFSDQTIYEMCGVAQMPPEDQQMFPYALELLRTDRMRTFRVDIETDSTIAVDEDQDKAARMEYIGAVNQLISNVQNVAQFRPELMHPIIESALFAVRAFRTGRPLEGAWERAMQQIEDADAAMRANPPAPPPDYEGQKIQLLGQELQIKQQKEMADEQFRSQELQLKMQELQMDFEIRSQEVNIKGGDLQSRAEKDSMEAELKAFKEQFSQFIAVQTLELEKYRVVLDEKEKFLEEARLNQEMKMAEVEKAGGGTGGKGGPVHINLNTDQPINFAQKKSRRKVVSIERTPTGFVGMSEDIDDEPDPSAINSNVAA